MLPQSNLFKLAHITENNNMSSSEIITLAVILIYRMDSVWFGGLGTISVTFRSCLVARNRLLKKGTLNHRGVSGL